MNTSYIISTNIRRNVFGPKHVQLIKIQRQSRAALINEFVDDYAQNASVKYLIVLYMIRDPVDTILSGYNYHQNTSEIWTHQPIIKSRR
eukprot:281460_1